MNHHNIAFLNDPGAYISKYAISCYNIGSMKADLEAQGATDGAQMTPGTFTFDLRLNTQHAYVELVMQAPAGGDTPIKAAFIPYLGQKKAPDPSQFGCVNLTAVTGNLVLTVGFTGCNFVVVNQKGAKYVYHEPTAASWSGEPKYNGDVLLRCGPDYDKGLSGLGLLTRKGGNWKACVQTSKGVDVMDYAEYPIP